MQRLSSRLLVAGLTALTLWACTTPPANVRYRCEADGTCADKATTCWSDRYCHPKADGTDPDAGRVDAGPDDAGPPDAGALDAGPGDAGPVDAGGEDAGLPDAGPDLDGGTDAGFDAGVDAGNPCEFVECGYVSSAGGAVECPWLCSNGQECGLRAPNACALPHVCVDGGWCWENPLPQGNSLRAVAAVEPRRVFAVGDYGTALLWNGEHTELLAFPPATFTALKAVAVSPSGNVYAAGQGGTVWVLDGGAFEPEGYNTAIGVTHALFAADGGLAWAGTTGRIMRRLEGQPANLRWQVDYSVPNGEEVHAFTELGASSLLAVSSTGGVYRLALKSGTTWSPETTLPASLTSALTVGGVPYVAGAAADGGYLARRDGVATWTALPLPGVEAVRALASDAPGSLVLVTAAQVHRYELADGGLTLLGASGGDAGVPWLAATLLDAHHGLLVGRDGAMARWAGGAPVTHSSGSTRPVNAVCGLDRDNVFAASTSSGPQDFVVRGLTRQFNASGTWWQATDVDLQDNTELLGCFAGSGRVWMTGNQSKGLFQGVGSPGLSFMDFGPSQQGPHYGGWGAPGGPFYFAAGPYVDFTRDAGQGDSSFTRVVLDGGSDVRAIAGVPASGGVQLYAVGRDGGVRTCGGSGTACPYNWGDLAPPAQGAGDDMTAIASETSADGGLLLLVAVGERGAIWRRSPPGTTLVRVPPAKWSSVDWAQVWIPRTTGEPVVVGTDRSPLVLADGQELPGAVLAEGSVQDAGITRQPLPLAGLSGVWGVATDAGTTVWVSGPGGALLRRDLP